MQDFYAIDFETANSLRGSPCAIGVVAVADGRIAPGRRLLIRPGRKMLRAYGDGSGPGYFDDGNVEIHGIGWDDVKDQPDFRERLAEVEEMIDGSPVVAHNANFDIGVVVDACAAEKVKRPEWPFACTLSVGRRLLPDLESHSLMRCVDATRSATGPAPHKRVSYSHHDPLDDARAAAELALAYAEMAGVGSLDDLLEEIGFQWGRITRRGAWVRCKQRSLAPPRRRAGAGGSGMPETDLFAEDNEFYGMRVCITGSLFIDREKAWSLLADLGAWPQMSVTSQTDLLVVGRLDPRTLRPGETRSVKQIKAEGLGVKVMAGAEFLESVSGAHPEGCVALL